MALPSSPLCSLSYRQLSAAWLTQPKSGLLSSSTPPAAPPASTALQPRRLKLQPRFASTPGSWSIHERADFFVGFRPTNHVAALRFACRRPCCVVLLNGARLVGVMRTRTGTECVSRADHLVRAIHQVFTLSMDGRPVSSSQQAPRCRLLSGLAVGRHAVASLRQMAEKKGGAFSDKPFSHAPTQACNCRAQDVEIAARCSNSPEVVHHDEASHFLATRSGNLRRVDRRMQFNERA